MTRKSRVPEAMESPEAIDSPCNLQSQECPRCFSECPWAHHGLKSDSVGQGNNRDPGASHKTLGSPSTGSTKWTGSWEPLQNS